MAIAPIGLPSLSIGDCHDAAEVHDLGAGAVRVVRIFGDIRYLLDSAAGNRAGRSRRPSRRDWIGPSKSLSRFRTVAVAGGKMNERPVEPEHVAELGFAKAGRADRDHIEDGLSIGR